MWTSGALKGLSYAHEDDGNVEIRRALGSMTHDQVVLLHKNFGLHPSFGEVLELIDSKENTEFLISQLELGGQTARAALEALIKLKPDNLSAILERAFVSPDRSLRHVAFKKAPSISPARLLLGLRDPDSNVHRAALERVHEVRDQETFEAIDAILKSGDRNSIKVALALISQLKTSVFVGTLSDIILENKSDSDYVKMILKTLAVIREESSSEILRLYAKPGNYHRDAVHALMRRGDPQFLKELPAFLNSIPDRDLVRLALSVRGEECINHLKDHLLLIAKESFSSDLRKDALLSLSHMVDRGGPKSTL